MKINVTEVSDKYIINFKKIKFKLLKHNFGKISLKKIIKLKSELELFNFFIKKKKDYNIVCDLGANVGVHSIFLSKIFKKVTAYEPLNNHFQILEKNKKLNNIKNLKIVKKAVSFSRGTRTFNVLLDNTTASHLRESTRSLYGNILKKKVNVEDINNIVRNCDLIKVDIEGLEGKIVKNINFAQNLPDFLIEVHNKKNSKIIFDHCKNKSLYSMFKLKNNKINRIKTFKSMPKNTTSGTLFLKYDKKIN